MVDGVGWLLGCTVVVGDEELVLERVSRWVVVDLGDWCVAVIVFWTV